MEPILDAIGADALVRDDADAFRKVSDETGREHQFYNNHVGCNPNPLVDELSALIGTGQERSLETISISSEQALVDLARLKTLIHSRQTQEQEELEHMYGRYAYARNPARGKRFDVADRVLGSLELMAAPSFYRTWRDEYGDPLLDGVNNGCERCIGWWFKESYRSKRGYKREQPVFNVSRLIAFAGNHLSCRLNLSRLIASYLSITKLGTVTPSAKSIEC